MLGKIRYDFSDVACFRDDPGEKNRCSKNTCLLLSPQIIILKIIKSMEGNKFHSSIQRFIDPDTYLSKGNDNQTRIESLQRPGQA